MIITLAGTSWNTWKPTGLCSVPERLGIVYGGTDLSTMFPQQGLWTECNRIMLGFSVVWIQLHFKKCKNTNTVLIFFLKPQKWIDNLNPGYSPQYLTDGLHFCFLNSSHFSSKFEMLTVSVSCWTSPAQECGVKEQIIPSWLRELVVRWSNFCSLLKHHNALRCGLSIGNAIAVLIVVS